MSSTSHQTTCAYCGVGCGVSLPQLNNRSIKVTGDTAHPANAGKLCVKGTHLGDVLPLKQRLLYPSIHGERVTWNTATDTIAEKIKAAQSQYGDDAFAFYLSGQLLTEDYYAANKLAKGFLGTANVDTNSRLCMSSAVVAHNRAFGEDTVPASYDDIELADCFVVTGSNMAWAHPVLFQRLQAARKDNPNKKLVVIDPRQSATAKEADLHLAIKPGVDGQLFNALLVYLANNDALDKEYIADHVNGFDDALQSAKKDVGDDIAKQAAQFDVSEEDLRTFFDWFATTQKTTTLWSMGINQSESGVDKSNAIINAHLATGRIGKPGATAFSITGQPNAMGGREVGGLANQLAVHRGFDEKSIQQVKDFWQAPNMATKPGLKAIELFDACLAGKIKVLWIMGTNPLASLPDANKVQQALEAVETVIVSDVVDDNDTLAYADIRLPALAWGEKDGTVTNSDRTISRQRAFLIPPGQAKADWFAIANVGKKLGFQEDFHWHNPHEVFVEHAKLTQINSDAPFKLDLRDAAGLSFREYQDWQPKQWPLNGTDAKRLYSDGVFSTPDGKANMVAVTPVQPEQANEHLFTLNTGRLRDQWHTMSRTGFAKTLTKHSNEFEVHINPADANAAGIQNGQLVKVSSDLGSYYALARLETAQKSKELFSSMHWNKTFANHGGVSNAIAPVTDPLSGQPASKHSLVSVSRAQEHASGFCFVKFGSAIPEWLDKTVNFKSFTNEGTLFKFYLVEFTADDVLESGELPLTVSQFDAKETSGFWATGDEQGLQHWVRLSKRSAEWPDIDFLDFAASNAFESLDSNELAAGQSDNLENLGNIVCTCFNVTDRQIQKFLADNPGSNLSALQNELSCGTNCGSCLSEVKDFVNSAKADCEFVEAV